MELIAALAAGIRGAENGSVQIYRRGTSTRPTLYADFEGTVHPNSGSDVTLDADGSAIIYVDQLCDVRVLDVDGTEVRFFVEGESAGAVEVISNSFTGVDYDTSASAAGEPTNLQTVLDNVLESFGSTDWNVLFGGTSTRLQDALGSIDGVFFNVRSPEFGAVGDGATDDTTAIQNALNAAETAGGGIVLFPDGDYLISAKLTVAETVNLWGTSASSSKILQSNATADLLEYGAGTSLAPQEIRGLTLSVSVANTGKLISILDTGTRWVSVSHCVIGDVVGSLHTGDVINMEAGLLTISDSGLYLKTSGGIEANDVLARLELRNTFLSTTSDAYNGSMVTLKSGVIVGCRFIFNAASGTYVAILVDGTGSVADVQILGNKFTPGSGTSGGIQGTSINFAGASVVEGLNTFESGFTANYAGLGTQSNNPKTQLLTRDITVRNVTNNASPLALQGDLYGTVVVTRTTAGAAQSYTSNVGPPGSYLTVIVYNNSGGALAADPTFDSGFYPAGITITKPSNGKISIAHFRAIYAAGGGSWFPLAAFKTDF